MRYPLGSKVGVLDVGARYGVQWPWQDWQREIPERARNVLVTLGGADPDNQTLKVIRALLQLELDRLEVAVLVGASNPHSGELEAAIRYLKQHAT